MLNRLSYRVSWLEFSTSYVSFKVHLSLSFLFTKKKMKKELHKREVRTQALRLVNQPSNHYGNLSLVVCIDLSSSSSSIHG